MARQGWTGQHVLEVAQFDEGMLRELFDTASRMKEMVATRRQSQVLSGYILANVFFEPSTRTACSFEAAMKRLGGEVISINESGSSAKKGETIQDTVRCLQCYCDVLVMRHPQKGTAALAAGACSKPLLNAGDGVGEHPTQALLDLFTIADAHAHADGLNLDSIRLTLLGDLAHGRTVHSLSLLASSLSKPPKLTLVSPPSLAMPSYIVEELQRRNVQIELSQELAPVLPKTDVLYVTRVQRERFASAEEYDAVAGSFVVDKAAMALAPEDLVLMHPLPRVGEIATEVDSDPRAKYFEQMENGMYVRMALLALVLGADLSKL